MAHSGQDIDIEQGNTEHSADTKGANRRSPSHRNIDKNLAQPLMSSSGSDPFYAFRDALKDAVNKLELSREKWRNLLENTNTAESTAFQTTHSELLNSVKQVEQDIRNIKKTVKHVERNRNQFPHIDDAELSSRKEFISQTEKTVQEIKDEINSRKTKGKMHSDERKVRATPLSPKVPCPHRCCSFTDITIETGQLWSRGGEHEQISKSESRFCPRE
eukprot:gb/GECG01010914.1/.p1 GENE.gb/GECG01010914.1/~~gb/GECG01010914.1/.p1  ORF type:complete len:217 (+),score=30.05 gb/GECG01010914.1/:1-651(+)